jgi:hypothetical protein
MPRFIRRDRLSGIEYTIFQTRISVDPQTAKVAATLERVV